MQALILHVILVEGTDAASYEGLLQQAKYDALNGYIYIDYEP